MAVIACQFSVSVRKLMNWRVRVVPLEVRSMSGSPVLKEIARRGDSSDRVDGSDSEVRSPPRSLRPNRARTKMFFPQKRTISNLRTNGEIGVSMMGQFRWMCSVAPFHLCAVEVSIPSRCDSEENPFDDW